MKVAIVVLLRPVSGEKIISLYPVLVWLFD